jgi:hypothetical protein
MSGVNEEIEILKGIKESILGVKRAFLEIPDTDEEFKEDVKQIIILLDKIYAQLFDNSEGASKFRYYGKYYIPTITKIINSHIHFINIPAPTEKMKETDESCKTTIKKLIEHFEKKYNSFYENESIDLNADIQLLLGSIK